MTPFPPLPMNTGATDDGMIWVIITLFAGYVLFIVIDKCMDWNKNKPR